MNDIKNKVIEEVKKIYDPEIPVNIYELGLIYKIEVDETNKVNIDMTLTSPNCPAAESLPNQVKEDIMDAFLHMIKNKSEILSNHLDDDQKIKLMSLSGVKQFPMRVKCATLSWHTLVSAMEDKKREVNTEVID